MGYQIILPDGTTFDTEGALASLAAEDATNMGLGVRRIGRPDYNAAMLGGSMTPDDVPTARVGNEPMGRSSYDPAIQYGPFNARVPTGGEEPAAPYANVGGSPQDTPLPKSSYRAGVGYASSDLPEQGYTPPIATSYPYNFTRDSDLEGQRGGAFAGLPDAPAPFKSPLEATGPELRAKRKAAVAASDAAKTASREKIGEAVAPIGAAAERIATRIFNPAPDPRVVANELGISVEEAQRRIDQQAAMTRYAQDGGTPMPAGDPTLVGGLHDAGAPGTAFAGVPLDIPRPGTKPTPPALVVPREAAPVVARPVAPAPGAAPVSPAPAVAAPAAPGGTQTVSVEGPTHVAGFETGTSTDGRTIIFPGVKPTPPGTAAPAAAPGAAPAAPSAQPGKAAAAAPQGAFDPTRLFTQLMQQGAPKRDALTSTPQEKWLTALDFFTRMTAHAAKPGASALGAAGQAGAEALANYKSGQEKKAAAESKHFDQTVNLAKAVTDLTIKQSEADDRHEERMARARTDAERQAETVRHNQESEAARAESTAIRRQLGEQAAASKAGELEQKSNTAAAGYDRMLRSQDANAPMLGVKPLGEAGIREQVIKAHPKSALAKQYRTDNKVAEVQTRYETAVKQLKDRVKAGQIDPEKGAGMLRDMQQQFSKDLAKVYQEE